MDIITTSLRSIIELFISILPTIAIITFVVSLYRVSWYIYETRDYFEADQPRQIY